MKSIKPISTRLRWADFTTTDTYSLVIRKKFLEAPSEIPHDHEDFCEVFWVCNGCGEHLVNGRKIPIEKGNLIFIRPSDCHAIFPSKHHGLKISNVALHISLLDRVSNSWSDFQGSWFWSSDPLPIQLKLGEGAIYVLDRHSEELSCNLPSRWRAEQFFLNLMVECEAASCKDAHGFQAPDWLRSAIEDMNNLEFIQEGTSAFYRLCGRSDEHASRCLKKALGVTPTAFINSLRLRQAARLLSMSELPILDIAGEIGFENLSHFYRLFKKEYGVSPLLYRKACLHPLTAAPN